MAIPHHTDKALEAARKAFRDSVAEQEKSGSLNWHVALDAAIAALAGQRETPDGNHPQQIPTPMIGHEKALEAAADAYRNIGGRIEDRVLAIIIAYHATLERQGDELETRLQGMIIHSPEYARAPKRIQELLGASYYAIRSLRSRALEQSNG